MAIALSVRAQDRTAANPEVHRIRMGVSDCWLIRGESTVLVDAGMPGKERSFDRQLKRLKVDPKEISLVVITHGHFDHIGIAGHIREHTGALLAIHESDRPMLEEGRFTLPQGTSPWGRLARKLMLPLTGSMANKLQPVKADILLDNQNFSLKEYGLDGQVIYTPGHTMGSVSLLLDNGKAFVGCLAHNRLPFTLDPRYPIFADYPELLPHSWAKVMENGGKQFYPGHGRMFKRLKSSDQ
jgi:glyoxylase-like metal-dependent hydrolase (beta-lactamase superfamily II)